MLSRRAASGISQFADDVLLERPEGLQKTVVSEVKVGRLVGDILGDFIDKLDIADTVNIAKPGSFRRITRNVFCIPTRTKKKKQLRRELRIKVNLGNSTVSVSDCQNVFSPAKSLTSSLCFFPSPALVKFLKHTHTLNMNPPSFTPINSHRLASPLARLFLLMAISGVMMTELQPRLTYGWLTATLSDSCQPPRPHMPGCLLRNYSSSPH